MDEHISDLAVDGRLWRNPKTEEDFDMKRLFDFLQELLRAGYRKMPAKLILTYDQHKYLMARIEKNGQPTIHVETFGKEYQEHIYTPFSKMLIEVVEPERRTISLSGNPSNP